MSLGSSVGNFDPRECATFLHTIANSLQPCDALLIGVDSCLDRDKVYHAYNDKDGLTHEFYRNGLDHANKLLGFELFKQQDWDIVGEFDEQHERHQAFALPKKDIDVQDFRFKAGERVRLENSYKFSSRRKSLLWNESGLDLRASYVLGNSSQYCEPRNSLSFSICNLWLLYHTCTLFLWRKCGVRFILLVPCCRLTRKACI